MLAVDMGDPFIPRTWTTQSVAMADQPLMDTLLGLFPIWSLLSQSLAVLLFLGAQRLVKRRARQYFDVLNECLCCFLWVWCSLETTLISYTHSWKAGYLSLFIRLMVYPYIFQDGICNPCTALYLYYTGERGRKGNVSRLCVSMVIVLTTVPLALIFCQYYWTMLGVTVSIDHESFVHWEPDYFLHTSPQYGLLNELIPSFLMFLPSLLSGTQSLGFKVVDSLIVLLLVYWFEGNTGSMMNPMIALACSLYWHSLTPSDYGVHLIVFWIGPLLGTWLAARFNLWYSQYSDTKSKLV